MKLCVNCRHYDRIDCTEPRNMERSLVSGYPVAVRTARELRHAHPILSFFGTVCGPEGNWFEERKEQAA